MSATLTLPRGGFPSGEISENGNGYLSPSEYLRREATAETKSEYENGLLLPMAGVRLEHDLVSGELRFLLELATRPHGCTVHSSDMRVRVTPEVYYYPDISIVCTKPKVDKDQCLLNPLVIVEILSKSTETRDRGIKFMNYQKIATLQEYVIVSQSAVRVERYTRQSDETWQPTIWEGLEATATLTVVPAMLPLAQIYGRLDLADGQPGENDDTEI